MFRYKSLGQQLIDERNKNVVLKAQSDKNTSDIDYIAMMSNIDLEIEEDNLEGEIYDGSEE